MKRESDLEMMQIEDGWSRGVHLCVSSCVWVRELVNLGVLCCGVVWWLEVCVVRVHYVSVVSITCICVLLFESCCRP